MKNIRFQIKKVFDCMTSALRSGVSVGGGMVAGDGRESSPNLDVIPMTPGDVTGKNAPWSPVKTPKTTIGSPLFSQDAYSRYVDMFHVVNGAIARSRHKRFVAVWTVKDDHIEATIPFVSWLPQKKKKNERRKDAEIECSLEDLPLIEHFRWDQFSGRSGLRGLVGKTRYCLAAVICPKNPGQCVRFADGNARNYRRTNLAIVSPSSPDHTPPQSQSQSQSQLQSHFQLQPRFQIQPQFQFQPQPPPLPLPLPPPQPQSPPQFQPPPQSTFQFQPPPQFTFQSLPQPPPQSPFQSLPQPYLEFGSTTAPATNGAEVRIPANRTIQTQLRTQLVRLITDPFCIRRCFAVGDVRHALREMGLTDIGDRPTDEMMKNALARLYHLDYDLWKFVDGGKCAGTMTDSWNPGLALLHLEKLFEKGFQHITETTPQPSSSEAAAAQRSYLMLMVTAVEKTIQEFVPGLRFPDDVFRAPYDPAQYDYVLPRSYQVLADPLADPLADSLAPSKRRRIEPQLQPVSAPRSASRSASPVMVLDQVIASAVLSLEDWLRWPHLCSFAESSVPLWVAYDDYVSWARTNSEIPMVQDGSARQAAVASIALFGYILRQKSFQVDADMNIRNARLV